MRGAGTKYEEYYSINIQNSKYWFRLQAAAERCSRGENSLPHARSNHTRLCHFSRKFIESFRNLSHHNVPEFWLDFHIELRVEISLISTLFNVLFNGIDKFILIFERF